MFLNKDIASYQISDKNIVTWLKVAIPELGYQGVLIQTGWLYFPFKVIGTFRYIRWRHIFFLQNVWRNNSLSGLMPLLCLI